MEEKKVLKLYRVSKKEFASRHDGGGARFSPGRWHDQGSLVIYTSSERTMAAMELVPYIIDENNSISPFVMITYSLPLEDIKFLSGFASEFPGWQTDMTLTRSIGAEFLRTKEKLALAIPSAHDPKVMNVLINPLHPGSKTALKILNDTEPYTFDPRLMAIRQKVQQQNIMLANIPQFILSLGESIGKEEAMTLLTALLSSMDTGPGDKKELTSKREFKPKR